MKRHLFIALIIFFSIRLNAQTNNEYESLIAQAGLFHLQKDYDKAIEKFEQALEIKSLDALNSYKLAGVYSLAKQSEKAFYYLNLSLEKGWTEAGLLISDPYFDYLRKDSTEEWNQISLKASNIENKYENTLKYPELRRQINQMTLNDQKLRYKKIQTINQAEIKAINIEIDKSDLQNQNEAKNIIAKYGWPKISDIGKDGQNNLWLVVQHADQDILFQKKALYEMEKHRKTNAINLENYAFLYDRVQCNLNYRQFYGTQVNWTQKGMANSFRPILNESKVNKRRKSIGLKPLEIYALDYGFVYKEISLQESNKNEKKDQQEVKKTINYAKTFYKTKEFQKVYDYYNNASTIMGGMSDKQNYEAAIVFAKIFNLTNENQYRDIALDFLTLCYYRNKLDINKLKAKREFNSFQDNSRWKYIINNKTAYNSG